MEKIGIVDVVDLLGLERNPRRPEGNGISFWVRCPFCGSKGYKMNINVAKDQYRCVVCSQAEKGLGFLDLYGRAKYGVRCQSGKGGNSKKLYHQLLDDLNIPVSKRERKRPVRPPIPRVKVIKRASDDKVSNAYTALLDLQPLKTLSVGHRSNLLARGLSKQDILCNGYRTFSLEKFVPYISNGRVVGIYQDEGLEAIKEQLGPIKHTSSDYIKAGLVIGNLLRQKGVKMEGVPGFFKLGTRWCFRFQEGMAIPTRNIDGKIVSIQMRLDNSKLRYMTVSSSGLPEGVNEGISRIHFPLMNAEIGPGTKVYLTEGPLKADVALSLGGYGQAAYLAIQGVNNTSELPALLSLLKERGVGTIYNALDMDRLTNPNVAHGSKAIRKMAHDAGLRMKDCFWDVRTALNSEMYLAKMCEQHGISVPKTKNIYIKIGQMTEALYRAQVETPHEWQSEYKGIDEYLLSKRNAKCVPFAR